MLHDDNLREMLKFKLRNEIGKLKSSTCHKVGGQRLILSTPWLKSNSWPPKHWVREIKSTHSVREETFSKLWVRIMKLLLYTVIAVFYATLYNIQFRIKENRSDMKGRLAVFTSQNLQTCYKSVCVAFCVKKIFYPWIYTCISLQNIVWK